jgi:hypothetical protein
VYLSRTVSEYRFSPDVRALGGPINTSNLTVVVAAATFFVTANSDAVVVAAVGQAVDAGILNFKRTVCTL